MRMFFSGKEDTLLRKEARKRSSRKDALNLLALTSWLLIVPVTLPAQVDHTHSPATTEDCTKLAPDLKTIVAAMDRPGSRIEALPRPEGNSTVEPGIHKLEIALRPLSEVWLVGKEDILRQFPGPEGTMANKATPSETVEYLFGGFVRLTVPRDGMYRISADSTLWVEVLDGGKPIDRVKITPRLHCGRVRKSLGFPLNRERSYWLEMSGSQHSDVAVLITEEPAR